MAIAYDEPLYGHIDTARATGFAINSLKTGFQRRHLRQIGKPREGTNAAGMPPLFTLRDAMMLAVAHRAWKCGLDLAAAFQVGAHFAHGSDPSGIEGLAMRNPGELFDSHFTVMVVRPLHGRADFAPLTKDSTIDFATLFWDAQFGRADTACVVYLNAVEKSVFIALRVDDRDRGTAPRW